MASAATTLLNDMVEQIVSGSGVSGARTLALGVAPAIRADAAEQALVRLQAGAFKGSDGKAALQQSLTILKSSTALPPATVRAVEAATAGSGMSAPVKIALVGGGLAAVWFLFIRKK